jgi:hypothetical protein
MNAPARLYMPPGQARPPRALQSSTAAIRLFDRTMPEAERHPAMPGGLTAEEILVIAVGRMDARRLWWRGSVQLSGWRRRLFTILRWAFGVKGVQSLASERLETLRLFTCMVVRRDAGIDACFAKLIVLGMEPERIAEAARWATAGYHGGPMSKALDHQIPLQPASEPVTREAVSSDTAPKGLMPTSLAYARSLHAAGGTGPRRLRPGPAG